MNIINKLKLAVVLAVSAAPAFAVPVTITRIEAMILNNALSSLKFGLSPNDTVIASDDINILQPFATSLTKAQTAAGRAGIMLADGPDKNAKQLAILVEAEKTQDEVIHLDLTPLDLSSDEIKDAQITPQVLSMIRRYLLPPPPPKAKP